VNSFVPDTIAEKEGAPPRYFVAADAGTAIRAKATRTTIVTVVVRHLKREVRVIV